MKLERIQLRKKHLHFVDLEDGIENRVFFCLFVFIFLDQVAQNCLCYSFSCKIQSGIGIIPYTEHTFDTMHVCQVLKHEVMEKLINY